MADIAHSNDFPATKEVPFIIEHRQEERALDGSFRPAARLLLMPALRTSGLWTQLPPEELSTLILVLTFLAPNGWCRPTLLELAEAMRVSQPKARTRVERLASREWQGHPLLTHLPRPDGLDAYAPGRSLVARKEASPPEQAQAILPPPAGKAAVVAYSRARYAKTREEVEAQIGAMMGWTPPEFAGEDPAVAEGKRRAFKAMTDMGMPKEQALDLLTRFDLGAVERQITWLPGRNAKNPARFLAAAIEGTYDPPLALRQQVTPTDEGGQGKDRQGEDGYADSERRVDNPTETLQTP